MQRAERKRRIRAHSLRRSHTDASLPFFQCFGIKPDLPLRRFINLHKVLDNVSLQIVIHTIHRVVHRNTRAVFPFFPHSLLFHLSVSKMFRRTAVHDSFDITFHFSLSFRTLRRIVSITPRLCRISYSSFKRKRRSPCQTASFIQFKRISNAPLRGKRPPRRRSRAWHRR